MTKKNFIIKVSELDQQQVTVLSSNKSCLFVGPTQSGKTTILLRKAWCAQKEGRSFFYIVLSRTFRDYLGHICKELGIPDNRVVTYYEWKHKLNKPQSDIVFVDDIDTFSYMDESEDYINDLLESSSLLFFTSTKDIQIKGIESFRFNNHTKTNNSLNQICDVLLLKNPIIQINNNWKKPHILSVSTKEKQIDKSFEIIKNSNCNNVGILVPTNSDIEIISTYAKEKNIIIKTSDTLNPFSNIPKLLTYHAARGIHFDEVIMPLLKEETQDLELICRTMKGCRYQLFLIHSVKKIPSWISNIPKELYSDGDSFDVL
jgi:DNA helicase IV